MQHYRVNLENNFFGNSKQTWEHKWKYYLTCGWHATQLSSGPCPLPDHRRLDVTTVNYIAIYRVIGQITGIISPLFDKLRTRRVIKMKISFIVGAIKE